MTTRRALLCGLGAAGAGALAGCLGGDDDSDDGSADDGGSDDGGSDNGSADNDSDDGEFTVTSSAFEDGATIPERYTADGENGSPPLSVQGVPDGTETLAVIADDPDAPGGTFVHWLLWNVPGDRTTIPEDIPADEQVDALDGARQGTNDLGEIGYGGPAPPEGDDAHTYRFTVHAVDTTLGLAAGAERDALEDALDGSTVGSARLTGEYGR
jgi:Raf kinase inhibitor-like YbhB/YbcL family protein